MSRLLPEIEQFMDRSAADDPYLSKSKAVRNDSATLGGGELKEWCVDFDTDALPDVFGVYILSCRGIQASFAGAFRRSIIVYLDPGDADIAFG